MVNPILSINIIYFYLMHPDFKVKGGCGLGSSEFSFSSIQNAQAPYFEKEYDFIQTIFPTDWRSGAQPTTNYLSGNYYIELLKSYLHQPEGRKKYAEMFKRVLRHWGFKAVFNDNYILQYIEPTKKEDLEFAQFYCGKLYQKTFGSPCYDHNYSRMSRAFNSFRLMGYEEWGIAFYVALLESGRLDLIPMSSVTYFKDAISKYTNESKVRIEQFRRCYLIEQLTLYYNIRDNNREDYYHPFSGPTHEKFS